MRQMDANIKLCGILMTGKKPWLGAKSTANAPSLTSSEKEIVMTGKYQLIWYLDDYQAFLKHPDPLLRHWATTRIEAQYPHQAAESFVDLLSDIDPYLQITAAQAIAKNGDARYEPAGEALVAIGPATIDPAAERLDWVDFAYDIYICSALSNIPTRASAEALVGYIAARESLEEYEADSLADLGHPLAIPYLRDYYNWSGDPHMCTVLYKLAILNNYSGPELAEWRTVALEAYADYLRH